MAQQKFFSGLTEGMINRASGDRPDRQKTHFYWPDEYAAEPEPPSIKGRHQPEVNHVPADVPRPSQQSTPDVGDRHAKHTESHIQFYDGVGSSFGELERSRAHERLRIEQFLRQQSEDETGEAARVKRLSTLQSKIEFYDYCTPAVESPGRGAGQRTGNGFGSVSDHEPTEDELDFDDRSSYRSSVGSSTYTTPTAGHRYQRQASEIPEHKRNSQRHLRSSINFHNGCAIADDSEATRKPVSVRESATSRVGVGLPNL